ncbi:MAG TPA: type II secretion system protein GspM [Bryobacteraceae bacterium]|nr:type II secretion system protein GspM [Bryobacteraceae bacterium]
MTLTDRDRRALVILGCALVAGGLLYWYSNSSPSSSGGGSAKISAPVDSIDRTQKRLAMLRTQAATLPGKEAVLQQVSLELAEREKGLIAGDTAEQAQAQLLQVIKRVAQQQMPPLDLGQVELGRPRPFGTAYGQVSVSITVTCRIEELVNFLAALSAQPELAATEEIRFGTSHPKQKTMPIRLTISGLVARRLVPVRKGLGEF